MKKNKFFYLALAMTMGLAACNSAEGDDPSPAPDPSPSSNVVNLTPMEKTKVAFTSNDNDLSKQAVVQWEKVSTTALDINAEIDLCKDKLKEGQDNTDLLKLDFLYHAKDQDLEMELYPLSMSTNQTHYLGVFYYDADGNIHEQVVYENVNEDALNSRGIKITIKKGYKFGFFWNAIDHNGDSIKYYSKKDLNPATRIHQNWDLDPAIHETAGTFVSNGKIYLGMEDWIDFDFQDMLFICTKELDIVEGSEIMPDEDADPAPVVPEEDPADPEIVGGNGSVEINLALNAEHEQGDWLESHLSIHVRDTTDVTVFLPVSAEYYCPADDMYIVKTHDEGAYTYNETTETVTMEINGNTVTLNVTFAEDGITIQTQGVNADVLKYLREVYHDGLTFEIYNYYNESLTRNALQNILNNSTVSFDTAPKIFVNAFGKQDDVVDPLACTVKPADAALYNGPETKNSEHESALLYVYDRK